MSFRFFRRIKLGCIHERNMSAKQIDGYIDFIKNSERWNYWDEDEELTKDNFKDSFISVEKLVNFFRNDLAIAESLHEDTIDEFISLPYDSQKLIRNPNQVD